MKKKYVKGKILRIPVGTQSKYVNQINHLTVAMTVETKNKLKDLFDREFAREHFHAMSADTVGMDAPSLSSQARILMNALKKKYDQLFGNLAFGLSPWMADNMNRASAQGVGASVSELPNLKDEGAKLSIDIKKLDAPTKEILNASAKSSTNFIKTVPDRYLNSITNSVYSSIATGNGLQDLVPELEKQAGHIKNWAHNTAMDQTRKVYNGLNKGRMQKIGITEGEWVHSGGSQHPRPLHQDYDGKSFNLAQGAPVGDDGGNYVDPAEEPNCRCTFAPIVKFAD